MSLGADSSSAWTLVSTSDSSEDGAGGLVALRGRFFGRREGSSGSAHTGPTINVKATTTDVLEHFLPHPTFSIDEPISTLTQGRRLVRNAASKAIEPMLIAF